MSDPAPAIVSPPSQTASDFAQHASKQKRLLNLVIDNAVYLTFLALLISILVFAFDLLQVDGERTVTPELQEGIIFAIWTGVIAFGRSYYILMEGFYGKTIGKMITGTRVYAEDGSKASWKQVIGRSFARLIPLEAISFLFNYGLHDRLSGTMVIEEKSTEA